MVLRESEGVCWQQVAWRGRGKTDLVQVSAVDLKDDLEMARQHAAKQVDGPPGCERERAFQDDNRQKGHSLQFPHLCHLP